MIRLSLKNLLRNKSRSFLTTIGIIIGVAAIVSLVSISNGIESEMDLIMGGMQFIMALEEGAMDEHTSRIDIGLLDDVSRIRGVKDVTATVNTVITSFAGSTLNELSGGGMGDVAVIAAIEPEKAEAFKDTIFYYQVDKGRMIEPGENAILVTPKMLDDYNLFIGSVTEVNGENFRVIGTIRVESALYQMVDMVIMDIDKAREITGFEEDKISMIHIIPEDPSKVGTLMTRLEETFEGELTIMSEEDMTELIGEFIGSLEIALWIVSVIAAIVGGVNVMNTMLMSVMERIQEFGVLKAVGWKNSHVVLMIVGEAMIIGLLGGILGVLFGFVGSELVELVSGIPTTVSFMLVVQVLVFAMIIGIVSAVYPAIIAAGMSPIEAVTYE